MKHLLRPQAETKANPWNAGEQPFRSCCEARLIKRSKTEPPGENGTRNGGEKCGGERRKNGFIEAA